MAKKSAMSKGYRKTTKAKPFLSKKEIIALVVIVAVILLGVILFNLIYDDGYIKAGKLQPGDVVSYASKDLKDRYKKIAEIGSVEGFTLEDREDGISPITNYTFYPDGEADHIARMTVGGSFVNASALVDANLSFINDLTDSTIVLSDVLQADIQGYDAKIYSYTYSDYVEDETADAPAADDAEGAQPEDNRFNQIICTFVNLNDTHTLSFHIYREGEDDSFYIAQEDLLAYVDGYTTAFTMVPQES